MPSSETRPDLILLPVYLLSYRYRDKLYRFLLNGQTGKAAGDKLNAMLEMGSSRPWQEALEQITGSREMDATAIRDYFAPLQAWLDQQNAGKKVGW